MTLIELIKAIQSYGVEYRSHCDTQTSLFFVSATAKSGEVWFAIDSDPAAAAERVLRRVESAAEVSALW